MNSGEIALIIAIIGIIPGSLSLVFQYRNNRAKEKVDLATEKKVLSDVDVSTAQVMKIANEAGEINVQTAMSLITPLKNKVIELENELKNLTGQIAKIEDILEEKQTQINCLNGLIKTKDEEIIILRTEVKSLKDEILLLKEEIKFLKKGKCDGTS